MSDFPNPQAPATPLFAGSTGQFSSIMAGAAQGNAIPSGAARTWVANLICYIPIWLPYPYDVKRVFWVNGSTNTSTNVDFGIYSWDGTRIYNTGSTVMGTVSTVQYVTPTEFVLDAGRYYFAWTCSNTTNRGYTLTQANIPARASGLLEETPGGFGLPATMTGIAWTRAFGASVCGVTRTASGF